MTNTKATKVPKEWQAYYAALTGSTDHFCQSYLNDEYAELARNAIAALCRKRPSPFVNGNPQTWACAILHALGQVNFLTDKASTPYLTIPDLCAHFGIAQSTSGGKAKLVRDMLGMHQFHPRWTLPSRLADSPMARVFAVAGSLVVVHRLSPDLRHAAADKGPIPHVAPSAESD